MADENTTIRIKDQPEDSVLANGDYVVVDSQAEGTRKFNLGKEISDIKADLSDKVNGDGITDVVKLTQAQYDQISTPSSSTLYIIVEGA